MFAILDDYSYICKNIVDMRTRNGYIQLIRSHAHELQSRYGISSMRLFGSVARDEHHEGSDIYIYVTMPPKFYNYIAAVQ